MKGARSSSRGIVLCFLPLFLLNFCCQKTTSATIEPGQVRPAVAACDLYKKWWPLPNHDVYDEGRYRSGVFPHLVALGYPAGPDDQLVVNGTRWDCVGTLISEQYVLTAAHCVSNVEGFVPVEAALLCTAKDIESILSPFEVKRVPISKIVTHPEYRKDLKYHDIAVIELKKPVHIRDDLRPACLMTEPLTAATEGLNASLTVLGWGAKIWWNDTKSPDIYRIDELESVEKTECSASYANVKAELPNGLDEGMICILDPDSTRRSDSCWGSNGEPVFSTWQLFPWVIGVASFGHQSCRSSKPKVYTSVYEHLDWIEAQVWPAGVPKQVGCWLLERKPGLKEYMKNSCITNPCYTNRCLCDCLNDLV